MISFTDRLLNVDIYSDILVPSICLIVLSSTNSHFSSGQILIRILHGKSGNHAYLRHCNVLLHGSMANWLKHLLSNPKAMGSNPVVGALGNVSENQIGGSTHVMRDIW